MSVRGLNFQTWTMQFTAGLNQQADPRALEPPDLAIATNVQYDKQGGIQTRYPYALPAGPLDILGGGTITGADVRRVYECGNEQLLFTKDALYSRSSQAAKWVRKGTHLAVKTDEGTRFVTTGDQGVCDRAELNGTIVYAWTDSNLASVVYVAAIDKTTGSIVLAPTAAGVGQARPKLVALATRILLFVATGDPQLVVYAVDPANVSGTISGGGTVILNAPDFGDYYDATRVIGTDTAIVAARRTPSTSYTIAKVTAGAVVTAAIKARTCDGPIAVSSTPDGLGAQVVRANGTNVQGDLIVISTLADFHTGQAIGTAATAPIGQIAAAHSSVIQGGEHRCYVFWSYNESIDSLGLAFGSKYNWVDTGNNLGVQADFVDNVGVASRAFDHGGNVYVWLVFGIASNTTESGGTAPQFSGLLQNTYFLYRHDIFLVAKAATAVAGGYRLSGHLPGVATTGTNAYAWCGVERRAIALGDDLSGYGARSPLDILFEFDSNEARRVARLGQTLYVTGGEILQYDGIGLYEVGFHIFPWQIDLTDSAVGALGAGEYAYKGTSRWDNARGERERSTTASSGLVTVGANRKVAIVPWCMLNITHKTSSPPAYELWRTKKNPPDDAPFFRVTGSDPTVVVGDNRYVVNNHTAGAHTTILDNYADSTLASKEEDPEGGLILENLAPPPASIILASDTRVFLAGVAGDPDRVWYSKQRGDAEIAAFHEALTASVPHEGGLITALAFLNETLVVFRERAIYALPGDGFDNTLGGQNLGPARLISTDVGAVNHESVAVTDKGLIFKSSKGWQILNRGWSVEYIGGKVSDYDNETPLAVHVVESQHQIRILTASRMLVLDTTGGQWFEWSIAGGLHACMWNGAHTYLTTAGPRTQQTTYATADYGIDVETAFVKPSGLLGRVQVDQFQLLGEFRSNCSIRVRLARDFWKDGVNTYFQDKTHTPSKVAGEPLQLKHAPSIKSVESLKIRLTITPNGNGESVKLTGLAFEVGAEQGLYRNLPAAQRQ